MKVVKKTGLVPVFLFQFGVIRGVTPDEARVMLAKKECELRDPPDWVETYEVADLAPKKPEAKVPEEYAVAIPENWETMHHLQKVKLAKTLKGSDGVKTLKEAMEIITTEVQRRSAAVTGS